MSARQADAVDLRVVGAEVEDAAEVGDLDVGDAVAVERDQQVGRLHVAVDQALAKAVAERHRRLEADFQNLLQRQQPIGPAEAPQRAAVDILHHQIGRLGVGDGVQDLHDVGVVQPAHQCRLGGEETLLKVRLARVREQPGAHALDRHVDVVERVVGEEHLAGGALAELAHDAVLADQRGQPAGGRFGRGGGEALGRHEGAGRGRPGRGARADVARGSVHLAASAGQASGEQPGIGRADRRCPGATGGQP